MKENILIILIVVITIGVVVFAIWFQYFAPCSWQFFRSTSELPARCLSEYTR